MRRPYKINVVELEVLITEALEKNGFSESAIERYVDAHRNCGWLRPSTPQDILDLAELHFTLPPAAGFGSVIPPAPQRKH